ncbi:hypothetical protein L1987_10509 [Smallanthus sonchifolius]|uniref:Uncharacterized protein n=1 Tax=Smallanthus sonchifolius TaxID=185202 RepID=A0ACB9JSD1_9ASTR|nr:hypothetical protein L1987_10509 [Smallanthus sonchifolius]
MLTPIILLVLVHWLSSSDQRTWFPSLVPFPDKDSLHRAGGSPWGVAIVLVFLIYMFILSSSSNGAPSLPPGPYSLPIVGYLPFLGPELHKQFTNMAHTYGPIFKFYVGSRDVSEISGQDIAWAQNNSHWQNLRKIFVHEVLSNKNIESCSPFRRDEVRKTIKNVYVIKETHRLHIVVPFMIPPSPSKACIVGGYTIPEGCTVILNAWAIHRNPQYWDNPLEFNPERFLTDLDTKKWDYHGNNMNFFPFGSGRRLCSGLPLAEKMQMFILATLLHSFDWSLPKGEEHDLSERFGFTIKKRKPLIAIPSQRLTDMSLYM